jgi:two-component system phosphate regulon response regulator PhoB
MMPKVSGFDVLDILRNTPDTNNIKIIMLTALSQESDKLKAQEMGVDDYLVKSQVVIADVIERIKLQLNM